MILHFLIMLVGCAGSGALGWHVKGWHCRRMNPSCPDGQPERVEAWKAEWRREHPASRVERHGTTEVVTPELVAKTLLDEAERAGVPLPNTNGVTTKVTNTRRKT